MKPRRIPIVLFIILLTLFFPKPLIASTWQELEDGLLYKTVQSEFSASDSSHYTIHAFKIDLRKFELRPLLSKSKKRSSIRRLTNQAKALVGVNANFFDKEGRILGLVVDKGKVLNPFKKISWWSIFYTKKSQPHLIHSSQYNRRLPITTAVQGGPRLVINGSIPRLKEQTSAKTAVGMTRKGQVLLVVTQDPIPITDLARLMDKPEKQGGLECAHAMNLDGGSSTQAYAMVGSFELNLPSYVAIPVGLGVFRKE